MAQESETRWWQSKSWLLSLAAIFLVAVYAVPYLALTNRGIREAVVAGDSEFLYVTRPIGRSLSESEYQTHRWLRRFFKPLEFTDPRMDVRNGKWRAQIFLRDLD